MFLTIRQNHNSEGILQICKEGEYGKVMINGGEWEVKPKRVEVSEMNDIEKRIHLR